MIKWLLAIVLLAGAAWWYWSQQQTAEPPVTAGTPPAVTEPDEPEVRYPIEPVRAPPETRITDTTPPLEPAPVEAPPPAPVGEWLESLLGTEALSQWFNQDHLIQRVVATVDNLPRTETASKVSPLRPPSTAFEVEEGTEGLLRGSGNDNRYRPYMEWLEQVDTDTLVQAYRQYYPQFQQAYEDLGYPDGYFNDRLVSVIDHLLETPEPEGPVRLVPWEGRYLYADPELEALSAGQKALLRLGPDHLPRMKQRLREVRAAITTES